MFEWKKLHKVRLVHLKSMNSVLNFIVICLVFIKFELDSSVVFKS